jgi:hypothetical protein
MIYRRKSFYITFLKNQKKKTRIKRGGRLIMKKIALLLTTVLLFTSLFSTFTGAMEMPLRVVVNGDEIKFPDAKPFIE